jgi:hypothetical protein
MSYLEEQYRAVARLGISSDSVLAELEFSKRRRPDQVYLAGKTPPILAPLREKCAERALVVEHYSDSLRPTARNRLVHLYSLIRDEYLNSTGSAHCDRTILAGNRSPLLIVVCPRRPHALIRERLLVADNLAPGIWRGLGYFAELIYLCVYALDPDNQGWDLMRWAFPPNPAQPDTRHRIFSNPKVSTSLKRQLWELIMTEQLTTSEHYRDLSFDEVLERGIEQGIEKGIEQGIEKGIEQGMEKGIEQGIKLGQLRGKIELLKTELEALDEGPLRARFQSRLEELQAELDTFRRK